MRWTGRRGFLTHLIRFPVGCLLVLVSLVPGDGLCQEKVQLFVDEVRFQNFPASMKDTLAPWGSALAAEITGALEGAPGFSAMTLENLKAQLGKERIRATLACEDSACVNRIVESFGCSETLFPVVRYISKDRAQVTVTHTAGWEKVASRGPMVVPPTYESLTGALRSLSRELFGVSTPVVPPGTSGLEEKLADLERARKEREAAERRENEARAAAQKEHAAKVSKEWEQVKQVADGGGPEGRQAVELFLSMYKGHPLGNPKEAAAKKLLEKVTDSGGVGAGRAPIEWVYSKPSGVSFARSETTVSQYRACVEAGKCESKHHQTKSDNKYCNWGYSDRDDHPMNCVDWYGADQFCEWAGGRLPTEQEWEAEAGAGGSRQYPWGNQEVSCDFSVWGDGSNTDGCGKDHTWPVCSKRRGDSVSGLCDMAGNVWEWTSSWYDSDKKSRVLRGGSWRRGGPVGFRASSRSGSTPARRYYSGGFRCVVSSQ